MITLAACRDGNRSCRLAVDYAWATRCGQFAGSNGSGLLSGFLCTRQSDISSDVTMREFLLLASMSSHAGARPRSTWASLRLSLESDCSRRPTRGGLVAFAGT